MATEFYTRDTMDNIETQKTRADLRAEQRAEVVDSVADIAKREFSILHPENRVRAYRDLQVRSGRAADDQERVNDREGVPE